MIGGLLSLVPTRVASRADVQSTLRDGGHSATAGRRGTLLQQVFVVAQIALAVILLTVAGLMSRTVIRLSRVDLGFEPEGLIEGTPSFPHPWRVKERYLPVTRDIQVQLDRLPGVGASGVSASVPLGPRGALPRITLEGQGEPLPPGLVPASATAVTPGFFRALEVQLVRGREFGSADLENTQPVAIINQWAAAHWWPGADPLGRSFRVDTLPGAPPVTVTVVGVVADHKAAQPNLLLAEDAPEIYRPYEQAPSAFPTFYVRATVDPAPLLKPIRELLARLVPDRPVFASLTAEQVSDQLGGVRVNAFQILGFAVVGLGLALMGIYGLLSYAVSRRTQELGVRGALGASRGQLTTLVLVDAIRLTVIGLAIGLPLASVAVRPIQSALYGTSPTDPLVYGVVGVAVVVVTVAASLVPARRASRVDPLVALRS
jgi:putative ABC transport system permease protein